MADTGHANNVASFATMISFVVGYGAVYDPSNAALALAALQAKLTAGNAGIDAVSAAVAPKRVAVNTRQDAFDGIRKLATRVVAAFEASGASKEAVTDAKSLLKKLNGARIGSLQEDDPNTPEDESAGNSVSQQSYTQLVEHLDNLIELLVADGNYAPNLAGLEIADLQTLSADLKAANAGVTAQEVPLSNARITRNEALYAEGTGLVDIAALVKKYVKSLFGADSPQFAQISGLVFKGPR